MNEPNKDYLRPGSNLNAPQLPTQQPPWCLVFYPSLCALSGIIALVISNKDVSMYKANLNCIPKLRTTTSRGVSVPLSGLARKLVGLLFYIIVLWWLFQLPRWLLRYPSAINLPGKGENRFCV